MGRFVPTQRSSDPMAGTTAIHTVMTRFVTFYERYRRPAVSRAIRQVTDGSAAPRRVSAARRRSRTVCHRTKCWTTTSADGWRTDTFDHPRACAGLGAGDASGGAVSRCGEFTSG